mmetsp:Transcript_21150/g.18388  ORF Transcript_21150/g.18388 Transcript_21150/m.18388 type:complete len:150 (+) Transcript_21150:652-1101(+)
MFKLSWGDYHHKLSLQSTVNLMCYTFVKIRNKKIGDHVYNIKFCPIYYNYLMFNDRKRGLIKKSSFLDGDRQINWNKFDLYAGENLNEKVFVAQDINDVTEHKSKLVSLILIPLKKKDGESIKKDERISLFNKFFAGLKEKLSKYSYSG